MIIPFLFAITSSAATASQVDDYIYRGPRPELQWLLDNHFDAVIDLESGIYEATHDDDYEHEVDIVRTKLHWSDFTAPTADQLREAAKLMKRYSDLHLKTYVHCLQGKDRTGMAVAAYKMLYKGVSRQDAIKDMYAHGFHKFPYCYWVKALETL